jgi:hypothetical protein
MAKRKTLDGQLIRELLGKSKFLMLNLDMVKKIGLNESLLLTYLLDKFEYFLEIDSNILNSGMVFYRTDIEDKIGLSSYTQRKSEKKLSDLKIIQVEIYFDNKHTYNIYKINMEKLVEIVVNTPLENLREGSKNEA